MTSPKATARGRWLLSPTIRHLSGVRGCNTLDVAMSRIPQSHRVLRKAIGPIRPIFKPVRPISNQKAEAFERAIEFRQIEWLAKVFVAPGFECHLFHAVIIVSSNSHNRSALAVFLEFAKSLYGL